MHSYSGAHCSLHHRGRRSRLLPSRVSFRFRASPLASRLANTSGRIVFNPPRRIYGLAVRLRLLSTPPSRATQLPSTTDSQCLCPMGTSTPLLVCTLRRTSRSFQLRNVSHAINAPVRPEPNIPHSVFSVPRVSQLEAAATFTS